MPIYVYSCTDCGDEVEVICSLGRRDESRLHSEEVEDSGCGGALVRQEVSGFALGEPGYQCGALLPTGEVVPGNFGKDAPKTKKRWRRP